MIEFTEDDFVPSRSSAGDTRPAKGVLSGASLQGENEELSLRPADLTTFIGQARVREQLELILSSARHRGVVPDHILFSGPPGLGKTSLACLLYTSPSPRD